MLASIYHTYGSYGILNHPDVDGFYHPFMVHFGGWPGPRPT